MRRPGPAPADCQDRRGPALSAYAKAAIPNLPYDNPDGSPLKIDGDYFGTPRNPADLTPGPFANPADGPLHLKVR